MGKSRLGKLVHLNFAMSEAQWRRARHVAVEHRLTLTGILRMALDDYLAAHTDVPTKDIYGDRREFIQPITQVVAAIEPIIKPPLPRVGKRRGRPRRTSMEV